MRQKINENKTAQIGVIAVLILGVGFLFMTRVMNRDSGATEATPTADAATATVTDPAAVTDPTLSAAPVTGAAPALGGLPTIDDAPLPTDLVSAYRSGSTVVLLLVREGGIDDRAVRAATEQVAAASGAALFVDSARNVSRYTQITQAVGLDRVPALIVLRPKTLSSGTATASVSYGFQDAQSVQQAITDALYDGRAVGYSPD